MYLGLSVHLLLGVLRHLDSLEPKFHISLVLDTEVDEIDLVRGSHQIPDELYADIKKWEPRINTQNDTCWSPGKE